MWLMVGCGAVALIGGILFLIAPDAFIQPGPPKGKVLFNTDAWLSDHRVCAGICLTAMGIFCLSSAVYVWMRLNMWRF